MTHKKKGYRLGFTIIEVMLALFITAILVAILSIVFNTGLRAYRQGKDLLEIARKAQLVMGTITSELSGAIIITASSVSLQGGANDVYFMAPVDNPSALDLCEIGYYRDSPTNTLRRYFVTATSTSYYEYPSTVSYNYNAVGSFDIFCEDITKFELYYYDGTNWTLSWTNTSKLPQMVEIKLEIQGNYPQNAPIQKKEFITRIYLPNSTNN